MKTSNDDEDDVEQVEHGERQNSGPAVLEQHHLVNSHDKHNSGLLSVSQQSAYLRAQNDTGKNKKKSQPRRVKTEHEPRKFIRSFNHSNQFNHSFIILVIHSFVHSLFQSFILSIIHSFM